MLSKILAFFGPVSNSIKGVINLEELNRVVLTSGTAGLIAAVLGTLAAVQSDLSNIIEVPFLIGPATALLTQLVDLLRRRQHGADIPA